MDEEKNGDNEDSEIVQNEGEAAAIRNGVTISGKG